MIRRALLVPAAALALSTAAIAAPVVATTSHSPVAVASARPVLDSPDVRTCPSYQHLVGATCFTNQLDSTTGKARKVSGWGWFVLAFASLGSLLAG